MSDSRTPYREAKMPLPPSSLDSGTERNSDVEVQYQSFEREEEEENMDYEGPRGKKRAKPKKKPHKISTTEDEDAGASPGPSTKKGKPEIGENGPAQPKEINKQTEYTRTTSNPTPQEVTLREQMGQAQTTFIHTIAAVGALMDEKARANLTETKFLPQGRLAERPQEDHKSYLEAASTTASGVVRIRETGMGAANDARVEEEGAQTSSAIVQKPALLIYPTKPKTNSEYSQVMEPLRVAISPEELGLNDLETRKVKGGALVASSSSEGIVRLEREINSKRALREKLQAKKPFRRNPQILVKGISSTIEDLDLKTAVINQNHLNGASEDLKVVRTFPNRDGTKTVVFEVAPELFRQIKTKRRLIVGWTSCSVEENLHVLFCRRCSRYGHTMTRCQECPRCIHCGKDHSGADCDGRSRRTCLACEENPQVHATDTEHSSSDADCPTYKWYVARLRQKINYG
ncbi:hypothetical protein HPB47_014327 [Ixodes persulcatus]|uniref:Uncharacterized protein n=1 Tax=Ixodes persulcatus TaxID=34615 RepID=A0AC60QXE2_IXOPE|nr:hypothetical protein HPB47_014327 [Ixodes persulcatus]